MSSSGVDRRGVQRLLIEAKQVRFLAGRIDILSAHFIGSPYKAFPLIGSASAPEVFVALLDGFDCVTYIETVLALACSRTVDGFIAGLRRIRYQHGRIDWKMRNHYMTGWIRNNLRDGTIHSIPASGIPTVTRERVLNVVPGLSARRAIVKCVPRSAMPRLGRRLSTGDLIFFASTRTHLDFFHAGIVIRTGERLLMRHAARSKGGVVEQELDDFLKANRMAGVVVVRPGHRENPGK